MHDRIKELAEQAGFILWADEEWKPEGETIDWSTSYDNELVKLVELIVRECVGVLQHRENHVVIVNSIKEIKEHFGVK